MAKACSRLSFAHGPAMIARLGSPIVASPTRTTVLSGRRSSVINLYGFVTLMTSATPARFSKRRPSIGPSLPVMPIAVRVAPGMGCARKPTASITLTTASISDAVALGFITINIDRKWLDRFDRRGDRSPGREMNQRPLKTVAFYRQIPSADVEADRKPFAAFAEQTMSALIAHEYKNSPTIVDHK